MTQTSESGHWYDTNGEPCYTQITASGPNKGKDRKTTLGDARKLNLVPSVTTILGVQAKPFLIRWQIEQALLAALTLPRNEGEALHVFMERARQDADSIASEAAKIGTEIHADIERGFLGLPSLKYHSVYLTVLNELEKIAPSQTWIAEESFCSVAGYGGKIDLRSEDGKYIVDFKTKDNLEKKKDSQLVFDGYGMQLAAYSLGMGHISKRVNIFIDRADTNIVKTYIWPQDTFGKHADMFNLLLDFWKLSKDYYPQVAS